MPQAKPPPQFAPRAKVRISSLSRQRSYRSICGRYKLIEVRYPGERPQWLAVRCMEAGEYVISRHRKRRPAELACLGLVLLALFAGCRSGQASITATASADRTAQVSATIATNW